ncbi:MAG: RcnB family protein [Tsuneonella sp.]
MNLKTILRGGGAATVAAAIALSAFPAAASARPDNWDPGERRSQHQQQAPQQENRGSYERAERAQAPQQRAQAAPQQQWRAQAAQQQQWRGQAAQQQRQEQWRAQAAQQQRAQQSWNRGDNRSATAQERSGRDWNRGDRSWSQTRQAPVQQTQQSRTWSQQQWNDRNRTYRDGNRNTTYRDGYRDRERTQDYRNGGYSYRDGSRSGSWRDRDGRGWNRDWRSNNNYNWYSYRNQYRDRYRLGRYYAPYSNYRYNRLSIGFFLDNVFFGSRYWINDPGYYRLPPAYGGLRWVRYYDDALLVDTYSGEVVDVIYDFFW